MPGSFVLPLILALPLLGAVFVMCTPKSESPLHRGIGLAMSTITFLVSLVTLRENSSFEEDYQPGDLVEFNAPGGGKYAGVLKEVGETSALFDFNHPLAGQTILFEVQLIGIL